jgi:hypothetical protein
MHSDLTAASGALFLALFLLFTHGLLLFNRGVYWDGWLIRYWITHTEWKVASRFYKEVGVPYFATMLRYISVFKHWLFVFKAVAVVSILITSLLVYAILICYLHIDPVWAVWVGILAGIFPAFAITVEPSVILYMVFLPVFYLAVWLALVALATSSFVSWSMLALSFLLFIISFFNQGLLTYFVSGWFCFAINTAQGIIGDNSIDADASVFVLIKLGLLAGSPFFYWCIFRRRLHKRSGAYERYNAVEWKASVWASRLAEFFSRGVFDATLLPMKQVFIHLPTFVCFVVSLIILGFLRGFISVSGGQNLSSVMGVIYCVVGWIGAVGAYVAVGRHCYIQGWGSHYNMIASVPISIGVVLCSSILLNSQWFFFILSSIVSAWFGQQIMTYLVWEGLSAKYAAIIVRLRCLPALRQISIFGIVDQAFIEGAMNEWPHIAASYMLRMTWGDKPRFCVGEEALMEGWGPEYAHRAGCQGVRIKAYTEEEIIRILNETTIPYAFENLQTNGPQVLLLVRWRQSPLPGWKLGLLYLFNRFFRKNYMQHFLNRYFDVEPILRPA